MKRNQIKRRPMADSVLKALEAEATQYREKHDGDLYFQVKPSGAKSWVLRYKKSDGRWSWLGLGSYPRITAAKARELASEHYKIANQGIDLLDHKKSAGKSGRETLDNTFAIIAMRWYDHQKQDWSQATSDKCLYYLERDILPALGNKPIAQITPQDTANLMEVVEKRGAMSVALKIRQWLQRIFSFAKGKGLIQINPAADLKEIAAKRPPTKHYPHLYEEDLPKFLKALSAYGGILLQKLLHV